MKRSRPPAWHVALALADAMLAGVADRRAVSDRCAQALGARPPWLPRLVRQALRGFADRWHPASRTALAAHVAEWPPFAALWPENAPQVRRWFLNAPTMQPSRLGTSQVAVPDLPAVGDLADWLQLPAPRLLWLADTQLRNPRAAAARLQHYVVRAVPKRHGLWRLIEAPKRELRAVQRQLLDELLAYVPPHEAAHGFRERHSPMTHAQLHAGCAVVLRVDLEDFFVSIDRARVQAIFRTLGYPPGVAAVLAGLCTTGTPRPAFDSALPVPDDPRALQRHWQLRQRYAAPHLPQGAPTSPALANLCAFRLDLRMAALADGWGARYSRYADDLVLSGDATLARSIGRLLDAVTEIIVDEGFRPNHRKTRVMRRSVRQQVVGLVINDRPNVARDDFDRLKAVLTNCVRCGPRSQNRLSVPDFRAHLAGRVAHVRSINPARGSKLRRLLDAIDWR